MTIEELKEYLLKEKEDLKKKREEQRAAKMNALNKDY